MAQETETPAMELAMASCASCDLMFMASERRQTCPTCGGEAVGPYFEFVLDESGLHQKNGAAPDVLPLPAPLSEEEEEAPPVPAAPAEEEGPAEEPETVASEELFPVAAADFLEGGEVTAEDLKGILMDLGAESEAARTAVGRLLAVRDLMRELAGAGLEPVAEVDVKVSPEDAPETSPAGDNGSETP